MKAAKFFITTTLANNTNSTAKVLRTNSDGTTTIVTDDNCRNGYNEIGARIALWTIIDCNIRICKGYVYHYDSRVLGEHFCGEGWYTAAGWPVAIKGSRMYDWNGKIYMMEEMVAA